MTENLHIKLNNPTIQIWQTNRWFQPNHVSQAYLQTKPFTQSDFTNIHIKRKNRQIILQKAYKPNQNITTIHNSQKNT